MLNKEMDDERLLALQETQDAIAKGALNEIEPIPIMRPSHVGTPNSVGLDAFDDDDNCDDNDVEADDDDDDDDI